MLSHKFFRISGILLFIAFLLCNLYLEKRIFTVSNVLLLPKSTQIKVADLCYYLTINIVFRKQKATTLLLSF
jgi:hypothetical protein